MLISLPASHNPVSAKYGRITRFSRSVIGILSKGLNTVGHIEINALGQINLCLGGATPSSKLSG